MALRFAMELGQTGDGELKKRIILAARAAVNQEVDQINKELQTAIANHNDTLRVSEERAVVARALWAEYNKKQDELASDKVKLDMAERMINALNEQVKVLTSQVETLSAQLQYSNESLEKPMNATRW